MRIEDRHIATLRALLLDHREEYQRLLESLGEEETKGAYVPLLSSAFFEAVERRFEGKSRTDIIDWIARIRATMDPGNQIDPDVAERLTLWVYDKAEIDDIDFRTKQLHRMILLYLLVEEQQYDELALEEFLSKARAIAERVGS